MKCRQHWALLVQEAPVPPQQMVSPPVPGARAQILFVLSVQHCSLVVQSDPAARGRQRSQRLRRLRFRLRFRASASLESAVSPTTATVDAAAAPSADLSVLRLVLACPTSRVSESKRDPSTVASNLGDAATPPASRKRRPVGHELLRPVGRREAAFSAVRIPVGRAVNAPPTSHTPMPRYRMQLLNGNLRKNEPCQLTKRFRGDTI